LLIECARQNDIAWFSSVFDPDDVAFLETHDCPRYKISAFEMLDWDIIKAIRETGKPIVMSVRPTENVNILQATHYDGTMNPLGISDHGGRLPVHDVPMIEWHLKLPNVKTPDSDFSMTPGDMRAMISELKSA
jgi:sialic acid synthase SpsE